MIDTSPPERQRVNLTLDRALARQLRVYAAERETNLTALVTSILRGWVAQAGAETEQQEMA